MFSRIPLGRPFGIGVYVHWTFFLLPLWRFFAVSEIPFAFDLALLVGVFACVVLHELGHALTARRIGIPTRDITLYPIGGVARLERMSDKPWEELWIAIGGPAVNVAILALLVAAGLAAVALAGPAAVFDSLPGQYFLVLGAANVLLIGFNMLPAFPMDGGRVFRAVLAMWLGQLRATRIAAGVGVVIATLLGLLGVAGLVFGTPLPFLVLIAAFIIFAGQMELRAVEHRHRQARWDGFDVALPARRGRHAETVAPAETARAAEPVPGFLFPPRIAVYTWDSEAGVWVRDPGPQLSER